MGRKYLLRTLGCKVNQYESQQIRELLESNGFFAGDENQPADLAVVNTCAVTSTALAKCRQTIRKLAREGQTRVVVVGCGVSAHRDVLSEIEGVEAVLGHEDDVLLGIQNLIVNRLDDSTHSLVGRLETDNSNAHEPLRALGNDNIRMSPAVATPRSCEAAKPSEPVDTHTKIIPPLGPTVKKNGTLAGTIRHFADHQRAFLKVQDGCDAHCTYCIIPQLRVNLQSKPLEHAVAEAKNLVTAGHREIIVTGIFLGAYGRPTALRRHFPDASSPLACLLEALSEVEGLARLRISSLEPGDVDETLLGVMRRKANCVPHLHLPLQSGSDEVLRRMNRQYRRDDFVKMIDRVRKALDTPAITTDIIVGFPGETEKDFEATLELVRYSGFCKIHSFPFSPRPHTAAARWVKDYVNGKIIRERLSRLNELERELSLAFRSRFVGCTEKVIVESSDSENSLQTSPAYRLRFGRTDRYFGVWFESESSQPGDIVRVRIDRVTSARTQATLLNS